MITRLVSLAIIGVVVVNGTKVKSKMGPSEMSFHDNTNCSTFSKFGRFNPYSVLHEKWFVFFYWAGPQPLTTFVFTFPTTNHTKHLKKILDGNTILPVMWSARQILMENQAKEVSLLVERGDRGEYWKYPLHKVKKGDYKITPRDVRLKQTGDNRILGFMDCADQTLLVMSRINDVPSKNRLQEEASRLGYRGRRGKSYLYQGHEWMPIPEDDEKNYWEYNNEKKEITKDGKVVGQRSIEVFPSDDSKDKNEEEKLIPNPLVAANEEELKGRCDKIEPELWSDPKPRKVIDPDKIPVTSDELNDAEKYYLEDTQTVEPQQQENNLAKQNGPLKEIKQEYKNQNDAKGSPGYTEEYTIKRKNEDTNTNSKNTDTKDTNTEDTNTNSKNTDTKDTNTEDTNSKNTSTKDTKKKSTDPKKKKTDPKKKNTKTKKKNKKTKKAEHDDCESCYEMRAVSGDHDADLPDLVRSGTTSNVKSSHREIQYKDSKLPEIKGVKPEKGVNYFKY